jgi:hypothetical protein
MYKTIHENTCFYFILDLLVGRSEAFVRGTPTLAGFPAAFALPAGSGPDTFPADAPDGFLATAPDAPVPIHLPVQPSGTSIRSRWHVLCDRAWDHFRYLQTRATG